MGLKPADRILVFDVGTTACKAALFASDGRVFASAEEPYPTYRPLPTWAEQSVDDWMGAICRCAAALFSQPGVSCEGIAGLSLSSQREGVVPLDPVSARLGPCLPWIDQRATAEARAWEAEFGRDAIHQKTGMLPDAGFTAAKIPWLRRHHPEWAGKETIYLQPKDAVYYRLTGCAATDPSIASRSMLYDIRGQCWWQEGLAYLGLEPQQLPSIFSSDTPAAGLVPGIAGRLGLSAGLPVVVGAGDRQCEALGAGIFGSRAMESTGTATNVSVSTGSVPDPLDARVLCSHHALPGRFLIEQGMSTTGSVLKWLCDTFRMEVEEASRLAQSSPAGANGVALLPFFVGARATRWNPKARGVFGGVSLGTSAGDLARAVLEGVAFEIRACLDIIASLGIDPEEVVVMGGGARSACWNRIKADVTGRPLHRPRLTDAATLGAMLLGASGLGLIPDIAACARAMNPIEETIEPDREQSESYRLFYARHNRLYAALEGWFAEFYG
ncbi:MAG: xylulokinase [Armatimonadetes bacterium]|nr:xylulokinase [Armatimonadota bacterium]